MSEGIHEFDLTIRSEVQILAPVASTWKKLQKLQQWKSSIVSIESVAGTPDAVGELLRIGQRRGDMTIYVLQRTVALGPGYRKVEYLQPEKGDSVKGYIIYTATQEAQHTLVVCDLLMLARLPLNQANDQAVEDLVEQMTASTRDKLDNDHQALKQLLEGAGA